MEPESKEYKIEDQTFYFRPCAMAFIEFEKISGKSITECKESITDTMLLVYAGTKAGMEREGKKFEMSLDEFIRMVDVNMDVIKALAGGGAKKK